MKEISNFSDAIAIIPYTAEYGEQYSLVVQDDELIKVPLKSSKILDYQLSFIGSSMKGAKDAAKLVLGTTSMYPVVANLYPRIEIWFPTESIRNTVSCAYLSLHRIKYMESYSETSTIVYGYGTNNVVIPVPHNKLVKQYNKAKKIFFYYLFK